MTTGCVIVRRSAEAGGDEVARWPLPPEATIDLALVDELARMLLRARRAGCALVLADPPRRLVELLDLVGLALQAVGEAEGREQLGAQEVVVADDPAV